MASLLRSVVRIALYSQKITVRNLATATSQESSSVQVPLKLFGLDGRYATALYTAAVKKNVLDKVEGELTRVKGYLVKNPKIREYLEQPALKQQESTAVVKALLQQGSYSELTINFFALLAENRRLKETMKIVDAFVQLVRAHRGEIQATITSAKELNPKILEQLQDILKRGLIEANQKLHVTTKIDPEIIGGIVVEVGEKTIDLSVAAKLKRLHNMLQETL